VVKGHRAPIRRKTTIEAWNKKKRGGGARNHLTGSYPSQRAKHKNRLHRNREAFAILPKLRREKQFCSGAEKSLQHAGQAVLMGPEQGFGGSGRETLERKKKHRGG